MTDINQTQCFVNSTGWKYMNCYDRLPPEVRSRLQSSNFNLCAACIRDHTFNVHVFESGFKGGAPVVADYISTIEYMEAELAPKTRKHL